MPDPVGQRDPGVGPVAATSHRPDHAQHATALPARTTGNPDRAARRPASPTGLREMGLAHRRAETQPAARLTSVRRAHQGTESIWQLTYTYREDRIVHALIASSYMDRFLLRRPGFRNR